MEAIQVAKRSFDLSRTSLDSSKGMILQETSDGLGWAGLHAAIVERSPVDRVISGAACLWINMALAEVDCEFVIDGRNEHHVLRPGTINILAPEIPLRTRLGQFARSLDVSIAPNLLGEVAGELFDRQPDLEPVPVFGLSDRCMTSLMHAVMWTLQEPTHQSTLMIDYLARALAAEVLAKHAVQRRRFLPVDAGRCLGRRQLQAVLEYIDENLSSDISLNELAAVAGLSRTIFIQRFKGALKQTPHQYLMRVRVRRAQDLLAKSNLPIMHIADACGFADHAHFGGVFKRMLGVTASAYRQSFK